MTKELQRLLTQAFRMVDQKRSFEAKGIFEILLPYLDSPAQKAVLLYQLGALGRSSLGDGIEARRLFQEVVKISKVDSGRTAEVHEVHADASENLMLLSLSYDDYESWAAELRAIRPHEPILLDQYPQFERFKEEGRPWSDILHMIACSYYSRDPGRVDPGLYGEAAATYHVILENRRTLRIRREDWAQDIAEHTALCIRLGNDTLNFASRYYPLLNPRPYLAMGAAAKGFIEDYLHFNPTDHSILRMQDSLRAWAKGIEDYARELEDHEAPPGEPVICRCGREMQIFKDGEIGILLATCRGEGIVRRVPGLSYEADEIRRAASKYPGFESRESTQTDRQ
jgi:tetratricopeptide (TPR) repeat protein